MEPGIPQMLEKINMTDFGVGTTHLVNVTHINDPKSFYVRLVSFDHDVEMLEERGPLISDKEFSIGKRVIFRSKSLSKYVRGEIEFILFRQTSVECTIFALDYGFRERKVSQKFIYLPKYNIPCPALAFHCALYFCEPKGENFDQDALDAMRDFVGEHTALITIMQKTLERQIVKLKTVECPDDVATMLSLLHFTTLTKGQCSVNHFEQGPIASEIIRYKYKELKIGEKLHVRVQSGDTIASFYVAEINDFKKYRVCAHDFAAYCKKQPVQDVPAALADGRCCGAKVTMLTRYERAIVKQINEPGPKAVVKLVDWGHEIERKFSDIKYINSEAYTEHPAIAIYCSSTEDQMWVTGLSKFLYPGYEFIIEIVECGNGTDVPYKVNMSPLPKK